MDIPSLCEAQGADSKTSREYLRFARGAINFTPPGFSSDGDVATNWSNLIRFSATGELGTPSVSFGGLARFKLPVVDALLLLLLVAAVNAVDAAGVAVSGFFSVFLDGGGGMSSTRPWLRNCELKVFTVFGRFSGSFRTSIEIEDFLAGAGAAGVIPVASSVLGFFGILPNFSSVAEPLPITLLNVSLSLSAWETDASLDRDEELEDDVEEPFDDDEVEEDEDLWELLRSLSLSLLLLLLLLWLLLLLEEEDDEEEEEDL